jgi:hypothetical protein
MKFQPKSRPAAKSYKEFLQGYSLPIPLGKGSLELVHLVHLEQDAFY